MFASLVALYFNENHQKNVRNFVRILCEAKYLACFFFRDENFTKKKISVIK